MQWKALHLSICFAATLLPAQELHTSVCNFGVVDDLALAQAQSEVNYLFEDAKIKVVWDPCERDKVIATHANAIEFVIRLRGDIVPTKRGPVSLHSMGRAFINEEGGFVADAYLRSIMATAQSNNTDSGLLLGFVIAHELGHLLLGPGHSPDGIMQAVWTQREVTALLERRMKFNPAQSRTMAQKLAK